MQLKGVELKHSQNYNLTDMVKKILIGLAALVVLLVVIGFFLPSASKVNRSITINAPASAVFDEINNLENWKHWSYWQSLDPQMKMTFGDKKEGQGASYSWEGPETGTGSLSIIESIPEKLIKTELHFAESGAGLATYEFVENAGATTINLSFNYDHGANVLMRWLGKLFMEGEVGKAFDAELNKLKEIAEAKPKFTVQITEENVPATSYVGMSHKMSSKDAAAISNQMAVMYTQLTEAATKAKVQMTGAPFCLYPIYSDETVEMVCALPVAADVKAVGKFKVQQRPAGRAVKAIHLGSYDNLINTHQELGRYIQIKMLAVNGTPWEVYITDPLTEKDTSKWVTEIYYPVKK